MTVNEMEDIKKIYNMLYWKNPIELQLQGVYMLKNISDLSLLIVPPACASVWGWCATVLCWKTDAELSPYLGRLLVWLHDLTYPGAEEILERLKVYRGDDLKDHLETIVSNAVAVPSYENLAWLDYLSELLDNQTLKPSLSPEIVEILQLHYKKWGEWRCM